LTPFAALDYLGGRLIHRAENTRALKEWLRFLKQIDRKTPKDLDPHPIMGNRCSQKGQSVHSWLARHPRFHVHFTPTPASWLNLVERFFDDLAQDAIREGRFGSVRELADSIIVYLAGRNEHPRRYAWRADGRNILKTIQRARRRLHQTEANVQAI